MVYHHLSKQLSPQQIQWTTGDTFSVYEAWTKQNGFPLVVDELDEDARLLWIGERRTDRVILYFHGMYHFILSFPHGELIELHH